ncbi:uncharacterized protein B0T15DRAFT_488285 [Chaetomium strumarium]|uniref:Uncharacterized protein n=1 Tax=Chaetomium strumarium TaxID=1170767 RepID=A0AAJ0H158_9PEZI|nr:hypothetical protein B0T15DRAFT_488285 [Chaetomium strumarium]
MRWLTLVSFWSASGVLGAAVPSGWELEQKPLGRLAPISTSATQYLPCEQTYGKGWENCGDVNMRSCYSPALGQTEDLESCARNAGFTLPSNETSANHATTAA